jgi:hypothetical protein
VSTPLPSTCHQVNAFGRLCNWHGGSPPLARRPSPGMIFPRSLFVLFTIDLIQMQNITVPTAAAFLVLVFPAGWSIVWFTIWKDMLCGRRFRNCALRKRNPALLVISPKVGDSPCRLPK